MSARNRAKAEATLQWAQVTRRYVAIYRGLMQEVPATSFASVAPVSGL